MAHIRSRKDKNGKAIWQQCYRDAGGRNRNPERGWNADWVNHYISRVMTRIGLPWATTHTLRHTFASHMVMSGVELWTVAKLLGHSSVNVTEQHYAHLAPGHAELEMAKLPYALNRIQDGDADAKESSEV